MESKFYHLRQGKNAPPIVTVCLLEKDGVIARGIAICSLNDQPNQRVGRLKSQGRAISAFKRGSGLPVLRNEAIRVLGRVGHRFTDKRSLNPILMAFERKILGMKP